jgi:lysophospholipid acyltransferase (LPLAT)-like uncharacterized protein
VSAGPEPGSPRPAPPGPADAGAGAGRPRPSPALIGAAAGVFATLGASWRVRRVDTAAMDARIVAGQRAIYSLWHARLLPGTWAYRGRGVAALISRSRDGDRIAALVERLGYVTARGSSSRGGREGYAEMVRWAERGRSLTLTPDGPRGPAGVVKIGVVRLASVTGLPVLPTACASRPAWFARSWDRFLVPPPFATVWIGYDEPIVVPPEIDDVAAEQWRIRIERGMHAVTARLDALAGERP